MQSDYVLQEVKGIKKSFDNGAAVALSRYANLPIFNIEATSEWSEIFTSTEGFTGARLLTELETPDVNSLGDGYSVTLETQRYGNAYITSEDDMEKMGDSTVKVRVFLERQRNRALRDLELLFVRELHKFFNNAFATTYFAAPDTAALYATHTWASGETFVNNGTAALSETAVDTALTAGAAIKDGAAEEMNVDYDTIVVRKHSSAAREAKRLFAEGITPTAIGDINIYENGSFRIIETLYITAANEAYWFLFDTKQGESPLYAGIKKMPSYREPILQNNQSVRQNVTGYWKQGINNMPFNTWGSTGAA